MFGNRQKLYFFDQERRSRARRERKPVEQLPFSLPFTGVSGTLKVEAYLRQQLRISDVAGESLPQTPDSQPNNSEDKVVDVGAKTKDVPSQQDGEQVVSKRVETTRRGKIFATFSDVNLNDDEEEDTQRFLFEENKFAAPNLLAHLGRILESLSERQAQKDNFPARARTFNNWANLITSNNRHLNISTSNFNLRAIGIPIPFHLQEKLKWNFEQLIVNTVYTRREWQTTGYKQQATVAQHVVTSEELPNLQQQVISSLREVTESVEGIVTSNENGGVGGRGKRDSVSAAAKKSKKTIMDEQFSKSLGNAESSQDTTKRGSLSTALKKPRKSTDEQANSIPVVQTTRATPAPDDSPDQGKRDSVCSVGSDSKDGHLHVPSSIQGFRRESSRIMNIGKPPRTRLEKYKYIPDKSHLSLQWRKRADNGNKEKEKEKEKKSAIDLTAGKQETGKQETEQEIEKEFNVLSKYNGKDEGQPGHASIAFSLMSKACEDSGWVIHVSPDSDLERLTVIEWARTRLQEAINKSSEYNLGSHGSQLVVKLYRESKAKVDLSSALSHVCITKFVTFTPDIEDSALKHAKQRKTASSVALKDYRERVVRKMKKGRQRIKRTPSGTARIELFVIVLPDGTLNLYYPSGKVAVCSVRNMVGEGKYTYVYGTDDETLLAYFTPTNAFCYDKHGKLFMCTPKEGTIYNKERSVMQQWRWKNCKLIPVITHELNEYLTLKITNRNTITLHFSARHESYKVNVGITEDSQCVLVNSAGEMMTTGDYLSEVAQQLTVVKTNKVPRTRREERKARVFQRKHSSPHEDLQEQRREDLDKIFPERRNLALDLPSDVDLYKLKRRIKGVVYDWMESYRLLAGISSPVKVPEKKTRRRHTMSAKSLPGKMPSSQMSLHKPDSTVNAAENRAPSAPPIPRGEKRSITILPLENLVKSVEGFLDPGNELSRDDGVSSVYLTEMDREKILAGRTKPPFRCGMTTYEQRSSSLKEGCPVALRAELLGEKYPCCRCRKREIPFVSDLAYDRFIRERVPHTQLLIISIVSSRNPSVTQCTSMLEQLYYEKNRNRSFPCAQAHSDSYRIVLYNVDSVLRVEPSLLVKRHNVIPGMFLMYIGGKLLFADHIFNGYGNARKDFLKQIAKTRKDYLQGLFLPSDFRFSPTPCRSGPRAAWGGEIGGISKSALSYHSQLDMTRSYSSPVESRLPSAITPSSSDSTDLRANGATSAASFINLGLAIDSPFTRHLKNKPSTPLLRKPVQKIRA